MQDFDLDMNIDKISDLQGILSKMGVRLTSNMSSRDRLAHILKLRLIHQAMENLEEDAEFKSVGLGLKLSNAVLAYSSVRLTEEASRILTEVATVGR